MENEEMIKVLEEELRKAHEKLDRIEQELKQEIKRLEEEGNEEKKRKAVASIDKILLKLRGDKEENSNNPENEEENSQIMQNDLIFTSAGELLNQTDQK